MLRNGIIFIVLFPIGKLIAQNPIADFTVVPTACSSEKIELINNSLNATSYEWDFCLGDFKELPNITSDISSNISKTYGLKVVNSNNSYYGFAINNRKLYRFNFGNSTTNIPTVDDLGDLGLINNSEGIDIINDGDRWVGIVGFGSTAAGGNLVRLVWTDLGQLPVAENIGNFGYGNSRIRDIKLVKQDKNYILAFTPYDNKFVRVDFGKSLLNPLDSTTIVTSSPLNSVEFPVGMSIVKYEGQWKLIVGSVITKSISIFNLGNDILSEPIFIKNQIFDTWDFLAKVRVINDGNFYAYISTSNGSSHLLDLKKLEASDSFIESIIPNMPIVYGIDIIKEGSSHYVLGVQTNLHSLHFDKTCSANQDYSVLASPSISFSQSETYDISLLVLNDGEYDQVTKSITISPSQAPQFTAELTGNCLSSPISFSGQQLSGDIISWNWNFGDGVGTSTLQDDTYTYAVAGEYQVKLSVTDANGCNNLYIDTARVYEEPIPDFSTPAGTLCMNTAVSFSNTTTGETGPAVSWTWDFNGEGASSEKEPTFTFLTPGNKTITLTSSIPGCADVTQQTIYIEDAPTTDFGFDNVCNTQTTTFSDLTSGSTPVAWEWDFGDGNNSIDQSPVHTYTDAGKYTVTLSTTNSLGCTTIKTDTVYNYAIPTVSFSNDLPCSTSPVNFTDESLVMDGSISGWNWNFGDGNLSIDRNPSHVFGQTGDFTVQLKAYSQYGCVDSTETVLNIDQGPEVGFDFDKACSENTTVFADTTNSHGISITNWSWYINNQYYNTQHPTHDFDAAGIYTVQQSVTLDNNCSHTISRDIHVEESPETGFTYTESCKGNIVTFADTTSSSIVEYEWRINGVIESTDSTFEMVLQPDSYEVYFKTTSSASCVGDISKGLVISGGPVADFSVSTDYGATPLSVQFTNTSSGANSYLWDFGDESGAPSSEQNPSFVYQDTGSYEITLVAYGLEDCSHTTSHTINVVEPEHLALVQSINILDDGTIVVLLNNEGSITYDGNNTSLVFTLDNGAELSEPLNSTLFPQQTISHVVSFTLGDVEGSSIFCASLVYDEIEESVILDKNCITLSNQVVINDAYPNPSSGYINQDVILPEAGQINLLMIDRTGAVALDQKITNASEGLNELSIDTTPYRPGLYILKIESGNVRKEMRVIISQRR